METRLCSRFFIGLPRRFFSLFTTCLIFAFFTCEPTVARPNSCAPAEVDVNIILPDGKLIRGLKSDSFVAQLKHKDVRIDSMSYDTGPRRIVFVLDAGSDLPADAKKAEVGVVSDLIAQIPLENSLALITTRGENTKVPFGEPRESLAAALKHLLEPSRSRPPEEGALDAVLEGVEWFGKARPGDAIVMMASEIDGNQHAKYSTVAKAMADHHVRLFSFLLGPLVAGTFDNEISTNYRGHLSMSSTLMPNRENLSALTWNSGGYMVVEYVKNPLKEYKLTEAHLDELRHEGRQMYGAAAEFYRVVMVPPAQSGQHEEWNLELSESMLKRIPQAKVLYQHESPACVVP
jgi:hypothetical protein